jgi:hypothetical protein
MPAARAGWSRANQKLPKATIMMAAATVMTLAGIATTNKRLYRAYLLKEQLRQVFALKGDAGIALLKRWLAWASRSQLPAFVELARRIRKNLAGIHAALTELLSNTLVETNTKLRLLTPHRLRVQEARASHRSRPPRPRRLLPATARPSSGMTHGSSRRAAFLLSTSRSSRP